MTCRIIIFTAVFVLVFTASAQAQSGTVNGTPRLLNQSGKPMRMSEASLTFQAPPKQRFYEVDDIIHVTVKIKVSYNNTANNQRKKKIETEAVLTAWTKVTGIFKTPIMVQEDLPGIGGSIDHKTQNQGRLTREETMDLDIACTITDIRDNGNLVIEGTDRYSMGEEGRVISVSGIVRPDTIGSDHKVDSSKIAFLDIRDVPSGNVYDTVRRPWGTRLIEQLKPF